MKQNIAASLALLVLSQLSLAQPSAMAADRLQPVPDRQAMAAPGAGQDANSRPMGSGREQLSPKVRQLLHWVLDTGDNGAMPFVIIDKVAAKVYVFRHDGQLRAASPALLGLAQGDDTVPGIGSRPIATIRPDERTTPAGRFVASLGSTGHGDEVLWVDYDASVALHRVVDVPRERRLERLASPSPLERRITYGCINVPARFFDLVVRPAFRATSGIVYVLPETRSAHQVFGSPGD